jgi:subtilisin-like proprotein convertase family protein
LVGLNVFSDNQDTSFLDALSKDVNISSNSWGVPSWYVVQDPRYDDVIASASKDGTIFVFAAGNDRSTHFINDNGEIFYFGNANNSSLLNNKYTIVVAAMDANGTYSSYSNFGDDVLVAAPAGEFGNEYPAIVTTDLTGLDYEFDSVGHEYSTRFDVKGNEDGNYTKRMNGTSAATPMVSGIVALMLNANPNLTYRDVKYILAHTARKIDENNSDWNQNAAGLWFNPSYGFGLVNAGKAVEMAKSFSLLPSEVDTQLYDINTSLDIPDNNSTGVSVDINVDENISIEYVNVWVTVYKTDDTEDENHPLYLSDLEIDLISPNGIISKLSYGGHYVTVGNDYTNNNLIDKRYGTNKFLDEYSKGTWKLVVKDLNSGYVGKLTNVKLKIYGHNN